MTTHRAELRARYPAILERASLSYGPGWVSVNYAGGDAHAGGLIDMAEALSAHVCEVCGNPGTLQEGPAFRTRCAAHTGQPLT